MQEKIKLLQYLHFGLCSQNDFVKRKRVFMDIIQIIVGIL